MAEEHGECRYLLGSLSDYVDATLEGELCAEIERHLAECENCRVVVDTLRNGQFGEVRLAEALPTAVRGAEGIPYPTRPAPDEAEGSAPGGSSDT